MTTEQAATLMGVSARHTRRILAAYRRGRAADTGERSSTSGAEAIRVHTHLSELLREREGIDIGRHYMNAGLSTLYVARRSTAFARRRRYAS